jgi:hypothetical protein
MSKILLTYAELTDLLAQRLAVSGVSASSFAPPMVIASHDSIANWTAKPRWRGGFGAREVAVASVLAELRNEFDLLP